jgi:Xaa-Pro aminopeptidase
MNELAEKEARLAALMAHRGLDAVHLGRAENVAWLTGGARVYVDASSDRGVASIVVTKNQRFLLTDNIESARLTSEENIRGFTVVAPEWHERQEVIAELSSGKLGSDTLPAPVVDVSSDLVSARAPLLSPEVDRYRALGADIGAAMLDIALAVEPGMREHEIAGIVARSVFALGAFPVVVLVAADARVDAHRHPLPTSLRAERSVMWVVCARRDGLIANVTRLLSFGRPSDEQKRRLEIVATIEAIAHRATQPGVPLRDILARIQTAYAEHGFAEAWRLHHQGGPCSYAARDFIVHPTSEESVHAPQAYAWNPSVAGAKSEDTVLCTQTGCEVLTPTPGWPMLDILVDGVTVPRPGIFER